MSAPHHCHNCQHRPGFRALGKTAEANTSGVVVAVKAPCSCNCHDAKPAGFKGGYYAYLNSGGKETSAQ